MPLVRVHNISDRPNTKPRAMAIRVGREKIRPGKSALVDNATFSEKVWAQHQAGMIWIESAGPLPTKYVRTSQAALKVRERELSSDTSSQPMSIEEARGYLEALDSADLLSMCECLTPALVFANTPSQRVLVARLSRALFLPTYFPDPEKFFWLRRWVRNGDTFIERD